MPIYTTPPTPAIPDFGALTKLIVENLVDCGAADDDVIAQYEEFVHKACRTAILEHVNQPYKLNSPEIPDGLIVAINHLLDVDGSRGCYSAVECHDAREKVEHLLAVAPGLE